MRNSRRDENDIARPEFDVDSDLVSAYAPSPIRRKLDHFM